MYAPLVSVRQSYRHQKYPADSTAVTTIAHAHGMKQLTIFSICLLHYLGSPTPSLLFRVLASVQETARRQRLWLLRRRLQPRLLRLCLLLRRHLQPRLLRRCLLRRRLQRQQLVIYHLQSLAAPLNGFLGQHLPLCLPHLPAVPSGFHGLPARPLRPLQSTAVQAGETGLPLLPKPLHIHLHPHGLIGTPLRLQDTHQARHISESDRRTTRSPNSAIRDATTAAFKLRL
jgi:hypothetical protein